MSFEKLKIATGFFDAFNSIGGGASCEVFSGRLFGMGVAVKRLKDGVKEWEKKQFAAEMALLSRASHPNICAPPKPNGWAPEQPPQRRCRPG